MHPDCQHTAAVSERKGVSIRGSHHPLSATNQISVCNIKHTQWKNSCKWATFTLKEKSNRSFSPAKFSLSLKNKNDCMYFVIFDQVIGIPIEEQAGCSWHNVNCLVQKPGRSSAPRFDCYGDRSTHVTLQSLFIVRMQTNMREVQEEEQTLQLWHFKDAAVTRGYRTHIRPFYVVSFHMRNYPTFYYLPTAILHYPEAAMKKQWKM